MASYPHSHHSTHNFRNPSLDTDIVSPLECSRDMEKIQRLWDETKEVASLSLLFRFQTVCRLIAASGEARNRNKLHALLRMSAWN